MFYTYYLCINLFVFKFYIMIAFEEKLILNVGYIFIFIKIFTLINVLCYIVNPL